MKRNFCDFLTTDIDNCNPNPCQNDGECEDGVAMYTCHCAAGFEGGDCQISNYIVIYRKQFNVEKNTNT